MKTLKQILKNQKHIWVSIEEIEKTEFLKYAKEQGCRWLDGSEIDPDEDNCGYHMGIRNDLTIGFVLGLCWCMNQNNKPKKIIFKDILGVNDEENYNK